MSPFKWLREPARAEQDALLAYSRRAMYPISIIAVLCFTPFVATSFLDGHYALGVAILWTVLIFGVNAFAIHNRKPPPIPFPLLLPPMIAAMTLSLKEQGVYGAFWCYPTVIFFYFVLPRRLAHGSSLALVGFGTVAVRHFIGSDVAVGFLISLGLVLVIVNIILNIVGDLQRRLLEQAIQDPLTGAYNRRYMEFCLIGAIERQRRSGESASLLMFDIDHFKRINDQLGHAAGDDVLKGIVELVSARARKLDMLFRVGGEEFLLLLAGARQADAMIVAETLRKLVAEARLLDGKRVSISIGVSELQKGQSLDGWIKEADEALYRAKERGRNRVVGAHVASASRRKSSG